MLIGKNDGPVFSVFTPTYNRVKTIGRVYESLQRQSFTDFEWLIVDDGSTDNTRELIEICKEEARFPVRYFYQKNGHKKSAFNYGVERAMGEFFLVADSDDTLYPHALEVLFSRWCEIPQEERERFSGVCGLDDYEDGRIVGTKFPGGWGIDSNQAEIRHRYHVKGDKRGFTRTSILRANRFPDDLPGFVPESSLWIVIGSKYKTRYINSVILTYYQNAHNQITSSRDPTASALGYLYWKKIVLSFDVGWFFFRPAHFLSEAARWTRFRLHAKTARSFSMSFWPTSFSGSLLVILMSPIGLALWGLDCFGKYLITAKMRQTVKKCSRNSSSSRRRLK